MLSGVLTDLDNPQKPNGAADVTITADAFKKWMKAMGYKEGIGNPGQEVFFIKTMSPIQSGIHQYVPNWHITAMLVHRSGGNVRNFHFKVEMGKSASHYWHYTLCDDNGTIKWVGDSNSLIPSTNQGGGGAGANQNALVKNFNETESSARQHGLDATVGKQTQAKMLKKLAQMITGGKLAYAGNHIS